jgi:lipopolysaccharide biosynthesis regulator YciM
MGMELLFLLLPVAAISGWYIGRRRAGDKSSYSDCPPLSRDLFQGLNYLLNEQQDQALEVFIRMSEVDSETVDLQFALGSLFLRRGEVDRAIRIHQNLIARPMLSRTQRNQALYELGVDYMRAGLLDRAESLFQELVNDPRYGEHCRRQLLDLFQQEKEWEKAIEVARKLPAVNGKRLSPLIAHYYCELAEAALRRGDGAEAQKMIKRAFSEDKSSVRASILEAEFAQHHGQPRNAIRAYKRIEQQDADYLPLIIEPLQQSYEQFGQMDEFTRYLRELVGKQESITLVLALARQLCSRGDEHEATELLKDYLQRRPSLRALQYLLELRSNHNATGLQGDVTIIKAIVEKLLAAKPIYQCKQCGFSSKTMHWQCPGCKHWNTVKPIHGIEGE